MIRTLLNDLALMRQDDTNEHERLPEFCTHDDGAVTVAVDARTVMTFLPGDLDALAAYVHRIAEQN